MVKHFSDYETTQAYTEIPQLPKGAYGLKVLNACIERYTSGEVIKISCDIAEGEYMDFFMKDYRAQTGEDKKWHCNYLINIPKDDGSEKDGWTKRAFKTVINAFEDSNNGYHWNWDEQSLKGKVIGGLFNIREYKNNKGEVRRATNLKKLISAIALYDGKYKMPDDDLLKAEATAPAFAPVPQVSGDSDLPW